MSSSPLGSPQSFAVLCAESINHRHYNSSMGLYLTNHHHLSSLTHHDCIPHAPCLSQGMQADVTHYALWIVLDTGFEKEGCDER